MNSTEAQSAKVGINSLGAIATAHAVVGLHAGQLPNHFEQQKLK